VRLGADSARAGFGVALGTDTGREVAGRGVAPAGGETVGRAAVGAEVKKVARDQAGADGARNAGVRLFVEVDCARRHRRERRRERRNSGDHDACVGCVRCRDGFPMQRLQFLFFFLFLFAGASGPGWSSSYVLYRIRLQSNLAGLDDDDHDVGVDDVEC
jgi:hypothetical protein